MKRARIIGTGSFLPKQVMTNDFLSTIVDTNDEWIKSRTGIRQRHIAIEETTASMSAEAARRALKDAGMEAEELELIIVATCTPDTLVPNTACLVQAEIGAVHATAYDISAACSGFVFALNIVDSYMRSGVHQNALIIGAETLSRILDWTDRGTCVLFADGAGAAVVRASDDGGLIAFTQGSDGARGGAIYVKNRENHSPYTPEIKPIDFLYMDGREVFRFATKTVPESIQTTVEKAGLSLDEIEWFLLHQANSRINQQIAKKLGVDIDKFPENLDKCGNTSGASVPLLLDDVRRRGLLLPGQKVVVTGFGAGLTWSSAVMEW